MWEIAPKFDWKGLRESYVTEQIYKIGDLVENDNNGLVGRIIRRGTNYLICVTEDKIMFKSWIKDVNVVIHEEDDSQDDNTDVNEPKISWGLNFINKYRKK